MIQYVLFYYVRFYFTLFQIETWRLCRTNPGEKYQSHLPTGTILSHDSLHFHLPHYTEVVWIYNLSFDKELTKFFRFYLLFNCLFFPYIAHFKVSLLKYMINLNVKLILSWLWFPFSANRCSWQIHWEERPFQLSLSITSVLLMLFSQT